MDAVRTRLGTRDTPISLWVYAAIAVVSAVIGFVRLIGTHPAAAIGAPLLLLAIVVFVLRGSRVAWSFVAATTAFGLVSNTFSGRPWWATVVGAAGLAPLLLPSSWRFIWRPRPAAQSNGPAKAGSREGPENAGESGWRAHPDHPSWMRYWNAERQSWLGVARTPRKVRKMWMQQKQQEGPS